MAEILHVTGSMSKVWSSLLEIPQLIANGAEGEAVRSGIAWTVVSDVYRNFEANSQGTNPDVPLDWPPLKQKTVASRKRPGNPRGRGGPRPTLTRAQDNAWRRKFSQITHFLITKRGLSLELAKRIAAASSWLHVKEKHGARTVLEIYGSREVAILRDSGVLGNSLSPGVFSGDYYRPPANQVYESGFGEITIGTSVPYAIMHHEGRGNLPVRRLWPEPRDWPQEWWDNVSDTVSRLLPNLLKRLM